MYRISIDEMKALEGSIAKWQDIMDGKGEDRGCSNCPLCQLAEQLASPETDQCEICIICIDTEADGCQNTPYLKYSVHRRLEHWGQNPDILCSTCKELACAERDYLIKLKQRCCIREE